ncbi:MAG: uracil-DNA glycosylase [Candidatus Aenigmatarchaeota archaeon]
MRTLEKIGEEIEKCPECKKNKFGLPVSGEGNPNAKIMFIGEAPGREESKTGRPFVGRAGKLLTELLDSIGIKREEVFITSPVKYYPGKRKLTTKEILHGRKHLLKQISVIKPKLIVALGNVALKALFPDKKLSITKIHGESIYADKIYFPTFHPAAALRFPKIKKLIKKDFCKLKKIIKEL